MKKLFTMMCAGLLTVSLSAQMEQGTFAINLNSGLGFQSTTITDMEGIGGVSYSDIYDKQSTSTLNLDLTNFSALLSSVSFGYFVSDNLLAGIAVGYGSFGDNTELANNGGTTKNSASSLSIGPGIRYYIEVGDMYLFPQLYYTIGSSNVISETSSGNTTTTTEFKSSSGLLGIGFGSSFMLGDYIALEPMIAYLLLSETDKDMGVDSNGNTTDLVTKSNIFSFGINVSLFLEN